MARKKRYINFRKEFKGVEQWGIVHDEIKALLQEFNLDESVLNTAAAVDFIVLNKKISGGWNSYTDKYTPETMVKDLMEYDGTTNKLIKFKIDLNLVDS